MRIAGPPSFDEAEARMRELVETAGLPPPDEIIRVARPPELHCYWVRAKLVVIVELTEPDADPASLDPTTADRLEDERRSPST